MDESLTVAFLRNFLGHAPPWYKLTILGFLLANPLLLWLAGPFVAGWILVLEFIFTLAMALRCYPLQPGGLLAIEAIVLGLATPAAVYAETQANFAVILLLIFMVAGIYFLRELLLFIFTLLSFVFRAVFILILLIVFRVLLIVLLIVFFVFILILVFIFLILLLLFLLLFEFFYHCQIAFCIGIIRV